MEEARANRMSIQGGATLLLVAFFWTGHYRVAGAVDEIPEQRPAPKALDFPGLICFWELLGRSLEHFLASA